MEDIVSGILWKSKVAIYMTSKVIRWVKHLSPNTTHNTQTTESKCKIKKETKHKTLKLSVVGAYNFSTWKAEAGGLRVQGHLLHNKLGQLELHEIIKKKNYKRLM